GRFANEGEQQDLRTIGARGFEPPTPCTPCRCATRLRHAPTRTPAGPAGGRTVAAGGGKGKVGVAAGETNVGRGWLAPGRARRREGRERRAGRAAARPPSTPRRNREPMHRVLSPIASVTSFAALMLASTSAAQVPQDTWAAS